MSWISELHHAVKVNNPGWHVQAGAGYRGRAPQLCFLSNIMQMGLVSSCLSILLSTGPAGGMVWLEGGLIFWVTQATNLKQKNIKTFSEKKIIKEEIIV